MQPRDSFQSRLVALTFFAKTHAGEVCGSNGLPLTPNSIALFGRAQFLKTLSHPNLCEYVDVVRGKHERTIIVCEYYGRPLSTVARQLERNDVCRVIYQTLTALDFIHRNGFVSHHLEPEYILVDDSYNVKLFNYGLYYMTNDGQYVSFPIGNVRYMPPERLLGSKKNIKSDVWSVGIILTELIFKRMLWSNLKVAQILRKIISLCNTKNILEKIAREHDCLEEYQNMDADMRDLIEQCLSISPKERPTPKEVLANPIFEPNLGFLESSRQTKDLLMRCSLKQIYYWWQLAGGDVQTELKKEGLIRSEAPILSMPKIVLLNGTIVGPPRSQSHLLDNRIANLSLTNLTDRLATVEKKAYLPLIYSPQFSTDFGAEMKELPLVIREKDIEYQFYRVVLFARLLEGYPSTRDLIIKEAQKDIPPPLRGPIWACLLGVIENGTFQKIDKVTPTSTDRQIDVDIPRCHQYDELLSSPEGHRKLKRLLKAWVTSHPQYVYWQGLDSLTAPFLYLNFNNEELAFLSLYKFIPKYLQWFFLKDNSAIIKEYLSKFSQLTAFHEPILARHLMSINFIPELFAIPWFLTMFSHVFPLHKIIHLWDKLILGDNSYPLFIGISVLKQLKSTLLSSGFNECILLFSDLPDIVMETCVIESQKMYFSTPKSVSHRKHVIRDTELDALDISGVELADLQREVSPRISAADLISLLDNCPEQVAVIDLRSNIDFKKAHIKQSINIPFTSISLSDKRLETLNCADLEKRISNRKVVVIVSIVHDNAVLFSEFLLECGVARVAILHQGFGILDAIGEDILIESN